MRSIDFKPNTDVVLAEHRLSDFYIDVFKKRLMEAGENCLYDSLMVDASKENFRKFMRQSPFGAGYKIQELMEIDNGVDIFVLFPSGHDHACMCIKTTTVDTLISIQLCCDFDPSYIVNTIKEEFEVPGSYIKWIYDTAYLESIKIPLPTNNIPFTEMYPFLGDENLEEYYDRFMQSDASILLLLGPPGLGKTAMIRGLLHHTKQNAILTYNSKLLESDEFFADWFRSPDENIVIMEDSDTLLLPRVDGNSMMNRFLNLGDGLITLKRKKMIFTTNLPNISSIDDALIRKGRCHDVIEFKYLNNDQANIIAKKAGVLLNDEQEKYTIADIFADTRVNKPAKKSSFGFV